MKLKGSESSRLTAALNCFAFPFLSLFLGIAFPLAILLVEEESFKGREGPELVGVGGKRREGGGDLRSNFSKRS